VLGRSVLKAQERHEKSTVGEFDDRVKELVEHGVPAGGKP
jgi:hypothetical protein